MNNETEKQQKTRNPETNNFIAGQSETESLEVQNPKTVNLSDFALFLSVMRNREAYESVLSIILDEKDLSLEEVHVEHVVLNDYGKRGIRLDVWARDSKNRRINTEMQNDTESDDIPRRARFYQSLIDTPILKSGKETKYRELPLRSLSLSRRRIYSKGIWPCTLLRNSVRKFLDWNCMTTPLSFS